MVDGCFGKGARGGVGGANGRGGGRASEGCVPTGGSENRHSAVSVRPGRFPGARAAP
jgi:hypothetical protein